MCCRPTVLRTIISYPKRGDFSSFKKPWLFPWNKAFNVKSEHTARGHTPEKTPSLKTTTGLFLTSSDHISIKAEQTQPATGDRAVSSARHHNRSRGDGGDLTENKKTPQNSRYKNAPHGNRVILFR